MEIIRKLKPHTTKTGWSQPALLGCLLAEPLGHKATVQESNSMPTQKHPLPASGHYSDLSCMEQPGSPVKLFRPSDSSD